MVHPLAGSSLVRSLAEVCERKEVESSNIHHHKETDLCKVYPATLGDLGQAVLAVLQWGSGDWKCFEALYTGKTQAWEMFSSLRGHRGSALSPDFPLLIHVTCRARTCDGRQADTCRPLVRPEEPPPCQGFKACDASRSLCLS